MCQYSHRFGCSISNCVPDNLLLKRENFIPLYRISSVLVLKYLRDCNFMIFVCGMYYYSFSHVKYGCCRCTNMYAFNVLS